MSRSEHNIQEIKLRKKQLQEEIDQIEKKYSEKAMKISSGIQSTLKPIQTIRDNPLKSLGISVAVGLIIGISGRSRKSKNSASPTSDSGSPASGSGDSGFTSLLMSELKRMAAKRAMLYISDIVDRKVMPEIRGTKDKAGGGSTQASGDASAN